MAKAIALCSLLLLLWGCAWTREYVSDGCAWVEPHALSQGAWDAMDRSDREWYVGLHEQGATHCGWTPPS